MLYSNNRGRSDNYAASSSSSFSVAIVVTKVRQKGRTLMHSDSVNGRLSNKVLGVHLWRSLEILGAAFASSLGPSFI